MISKISKLLKVTFVGCIVIAASVPAEAGLFDRIRNRNCGRKAGCCQPQVVCAPTPCRPIPCAPAPCAQIPSARSRCGTAPTCPCTTKLSCAQQYQKDLITCERFFGNNAQACLECKGIALRARTECENDPEGKNMSRTANYSQQQMQSPNCPIVDMPSAEVCHDIYVDCVNAGPSTSCARCFFLCLDSI